MRVRERGRIAKVAHDGDVETEWRWETYRWKKNEESLAEASRVEMLEGGSEVQSKI